MTNPFHELEELFHQPTRLELMSQLCGSPEGCSFAHLKQSCELTDGNLSRHLQSLEKGGAVKLKKAFVDSKPLTTVTVTRRGREEFLKYLDSLEQVLEQAAKRAKSIDERSPRDVPRSRQLVHSKE